VATLQDAAINLAKQLGIQKEVIFGFVNDHGRLPGNIGELEAWGNTPDRIYGVRRRQPNGAWTPITPGPTPGLSPEARAGWANHNITNAEDSELYPWLMTTQYNPETMGGNFSAQGNPGGGGGGGGSGRYSTKNGPKTLDEMTSELRTAGYPGPWDAAKVAEAYARTTGGPVSDAAGNSSDGTPGSGNGLGSLLDGVGLANTNQDNRLTKLNDAQVDQIRSQIKLAENGDARAQQQLDALIEQIGDQRFDKNRADDLNRWLDMQKMAQQGDQFQQTRYDNRLSGERSLYSNLAQNLLNASVQLGSRPEDYFKYNAMTSGGKDIFQQMFSNDAIPAFSAPTGQLKSGNIADLMNQIGMTGVPGGWTTGGGPKNVPGMGNPGGALNPASEANWMAQRPSVFQPTPMPDIPFMPAVSVPRDQGRAAARNILGGYQDYIKKLGVPYLGQDDQRLIDYYKTQSGLSDSAARSVAKLAADYYKTNGTPIPENILAGHIVNALGQHRSPNPSRQAGESAERDYWNTVRQSGQPYLPANDPRTIDVWRRQGLNPDQARWGSGQAGEFAGANGYPLTGTDLGDVIERARRRGYGGMQSGGGAGWESAPTAPGMPGSDPGMMMNMRGRGRGRQPEQFQL